MAGEMRETMAFHVNAPVDRVFDFCADFEATAPVLSRQTRITEMSPLPVGVGTVIHYVNDRFGLVSRAEVVAYSPPHTFTVVTETNGHGPFTSQTVVESAEGGGSTVRVYNDGKPFALSTWMRPFIWMFAPVVRKAMAKATDRYVEFARKTLEA
jgi:polyketide cyclase/dehydrase/lipid transport protein